MWKNFISEIFFHMEVSGVSGRRDQHMRKKKKNVGRKANRRCYYIKLTTKHIYVLFANECSYNIYMMRGRKQRTTNNEEKKFSSVKNNKFIDFFTVWRCFFHSFNLTHSFSHLLEASWCVLYVYGIYTANYVCKWQYVKCEDSFWNKLVIC